MGARLRTPTTGRSTAFCRLPATSRFRRCRSPWSRPISRRSPTTLASRSIFLRQLIAQARPEDVAVGISTSGGSRNIIMALEEARKRGMLTVALLGYDGGEIMRHGLVNWPLVVHCDYIPRIQEVQASIYHIIRETLEVLRRGQV